MPSIGSAGEPDVEAGPSRAQRGLVLGALALLLAAGLFGVEAWPLTGWRLFSDVRRDEVGTWAIQAVAEDGTTTRVSARDLGLGFRFASRSFDDARDQPPAERAALCDALVEAVRGREPTTARVRVLHGRRRLVEAGGEWTAVGTATDLAFECGPEAAP